MSALLSLLFASNLFVEETVSGLLHSRVPWILIHSLSVNSSLSPLFPINEKSDLEQSPLHQFQQGHFISEVLDLHCLALMPPCLFG